MNFWLRTETSVFEIELHKGQVVEQNLFLDTVSVDQESTVNNKMLKESKDPKC